MIVGVDNEGEVYLSLTYTNTDACIIQLFIKHLVELLDKQHPDWRANTYLLFDNCASHTCKSTQDYFLKLKIPILYTGLYSFSEMCAELFSRIFQEGIHQSRELLIGKEVSD